MTHKIPKTKKTWSSVVLWTVFQCCANLRCFPWRKYSIIKISIHCLFFNQVSLIDTEITRGKCFPIHIRLDHSQNFVVVEHSATIDSWRKIMTFHEIRAIYRNPKAWPVFDQVLRVNIFSVLNRYLRTKRIHVDNWPLSRGILNFSKLDINFLCTHSIHLTSFPERKAKRKRMLWVHFSDIDSSVSVPSFFSPTDFLNCVTQHSSPPLHLFVAAVMTSLMLLDLERPVCNGNQCGNLWSVLNE